MPYTENKTLLVKIRAFTVFAQQKGILNPSCRMSSLHRDKTASAAQKHQDVLYTKIIDSFGVSP
jgi:hypothetical protein